MSEQQVTKGKDKWGNEVLNLPMGEYEGKARTPVSLTVARAKAVLLYGDKIQAFVEQCDKQPGETAAGQTDVEPF